MMNFELRDMGDKQVHHQIRRELRAVLEDMAQARRALTHPRGLLVQTLDLKENVKEVLYDAFDVLEVLRDAMEDLEHIVACSVDCVLESVVSETVGVDLEAFLALDAADQRRRLDLLMAATRATRSGYWPRFVIPWADTRRWELAKQKREAAPKAAPKAA